MSVKEIEKYEIQEIAEAILNEIFAERKRSVTGQDQEAVQRAQGPDFGDMAEAERRARDFTGNLEARHGTGRVGMVFSEEADRGEPGTSTEEPPFSPRLQRRDFMALRAERRSRREAAVNGAAEEENRFSFAESGPGFDNRLPEKLSEAFCRDARRYDGAFERY